jgi:methionyl-tRNA formyltransferase
MNNENGPKRTVRVLLFGIYDLGFRALEAMVLRDLDVVGVVTKPDPSLEAQPLYRLARAIGRPVFAPESPREAEFLKEVRLLRPDLIAVAGYHKIFPAALLQIPPRGVLNVHGSLLPQYRGPCPWKWAIMNGERTIGATVQYMVEELDRGEILSQQDLPIDPRDTAESLFQKICGIAGPLLARTIEELTAHPIESHAQDERRATYYGYPTEEDGRLRWEWSAERVRNRVRGLSPRPGAWTQYGGQRVRVLRAEPAEGPLAGLPGMILGRSDHSLLVSTGQGNVSIGGLSVVEDASAPIWSLGLIPGTFFDPSPAAVPRLKVT